MKTKALFSTLLLISSAGSLMLHSAHATSGNFTLANPTGLITTTIPVTVNSTKLYLYSFQQLPVLTVDDSKQLLGQYLSNESVDKLVPSADKTIRFVSPKDVNTSFEHNLVTGDLRFHRNFARYLGDFQPKLPSTEEALKASQTFLEENKLMPANPAELKIAHIGGLRASSLIDGKQAGPVIDKLITLNYSRVVNNLPVIGPGSKMIVDIGEGGEILSLTRHWRELVPEAREINPRDTYSEDEAKRLAALQISKEFGKQATFEIINVQQAYFDNNGRFLQPVYAFQTKVFLPDQQAQAFEYVSVIPVLRKQLEPLNLNVLDANALRQIKSGSFLPNTKTGKFE
ncbi:MAG: hypothetical protein K9L60_07730 [Methylovulum sp.]|nr:hypothetical protein [Methylovulum sp.]MCF7998125.1 hypothetical protein [Methylovulum sp.]